MAELSRIAVDARAGVVEVPANAEVLLRHAAHVSAEVAGAWAGARQEGTLLTAVIDLPDAARLNLAAWLDALQPDTVELHTPAWSEAGMAAIGWPEGYAALVRVLQALGQRPQVTRVVLHLSAPAQRELTPGALQALCDATGLGTLDLVLRPVLGEAAPRLDWLAEATVLLSQTGHTVLASRLLPACALAEGLDGVATFASERAAAKQAFTDACEGCPARTDGRCDGVPADLLATLQATDRTWTGWETLAKDRTPTHVATA